MMTMRGQSCVFAIAIRLCVSMMVTIGLLGVAREARADSERVTFLVEKLKSDDFRVRLNAALALGATNEDSAVAPLCGALNDSNESVRSGGAVGLQRLQKQGALGCLKERQGVETSDSVKTSLARAIEALNAGSGGSGGGTAPTNNANAKYYIALSSISNSTGRAQSEVEAIVLKAIRAKLEAAGTVQIAPAAETADAAKAEMSKRKMKGLYLAIAVDRFDYSDGNLKVKVKIGVFSYPGKSLIGNADMGKGKAGVTQGDKASEDQVLDLAAGAAGDQFAQNITAFL